MRVAFKMAGGPHLVSWRLRRELAEQALKERGVEVGPEGDLEVHAKHFGKRAIPDKPFVFDVCDDHFGGEFAGYYREMCRRAVSVACSSDGLRQIIEKQSGAKATVIHEPYEYPAQPPKQPDWPLKILWYGHAANLKILQTGLEDIPEECVDKVRIVCNQKLFSGTANIETYVWNQSELPDHLRWCDVVFLPQDREWKSPNRLVEAVRAGRFVIASNIPAYRGFGMWLGDFTEGFRWLKEHNVRPQIVSAQNRVRDEFSPQKIGQQWYDFISAAGRKCGLVSPTSISALRLT